MTGIVIEHARFVEVQQRRARIIAALCRAHETSAPRARLEVIDESIEVVERPAPVLDVETTIGAVDGR